MTRSFRWSGFNKRYGKLSGALLATCVLFYLVSHALSGERGLYVLLKEQRRLEMLHAEIEKVSYERKSLGHRVQMLGDESLDLDLLEEQSRRYLSEAGNDEIMIPLAPLKK